MAERKKAKLMPPRKMKAYASFADADNDGWLDVLMVDPDGTVRGQAYVVTNGEPRTVAEMFAGICAAVGAPAPDFSLTDLSGRTWQLSSLRGKTVVVYGTR